jgi:predicted lipoprotein with Yx(FWY)xxD motif
VAGVFAAATLIAATACGTSANTSANTGTLPIASVPAQSPAASTQAGAGLKAATDATLGSIVTDGSGWTLYRTDNDKNIPPTSNCTDTCATEWTPAPAVSDTQVTGVDANLVGSLTRADGTAQLTLNGWPLYRYTGDKQPGDTSGQQMGQVWYVATPDGQKAGEASTGTTGSTSTDTTNPSGY